MYGQFNEAAEAADGFLGKFDAVLDMAHELNEEDPTLAAFLGVVRSDMRRHPEIARTRSETCRIGASDFFVRLVDAGVAAGEISNEEPRRS